MRRVKFALPLALSIAFLTSACNTIENRRSEYRPKKGDGPYTRSLKDGTWERPKTVDQEYEEAKRQRALDRGKPAPVVEPAAQATAS